MSINTECRAARETALAMQTVPLAPAQRAIVHRHLAECEACRVAIGRLDDIIDAATTLESDLWGDSSAASGHTGATNNITADNGGAWNDIAADDLFARIENELDAAPAHSATSPRAEREAGRASERGAEHEGQPASDVGQLLVFPHSAQSHESRAHLERSVDVEDELPPASRRDRWWPAAALVLAALLLGAIVWTLQSEAREPSTENPTVALGEPNNADISPNIAAQATNRQPVMPNDDAEPVAEPAPSLRTLAAASVHGDATANDGEPIADAVNIFATSDASWSLSAGPDYDLALHTGAMLVEFVGDGTETLTLRTADWSVRVVGTSFYADADGPVDVRVHTGAVDVHTADEQTQRVVAGQALASSARRTLTPDEREYFSRFVDPAAHQTELDARAAAPRASDASEQTTTVVAAAHQPSERASSARASAESRTPSRRTPAPTPAGPPARQAEEPTRGEQPAAVSGEPQASSADDVAAGGDNATLREEEAPNAEPRVDAAATLQLAREAQRARDWQRAADQYETWLGAAPGSAQVGAVRLDVARIYLDRLADPSRAMGHLEAFVTQFPDDVAAPAARTELCRIAMSMGREVAACAP